MRLGAALGLAALVGCYASEGSGHVVVRTYDLRGFAEIALTGAGRLLVSEGDYAVSASAEDDVLPSLRVELHDDVLVLGRHVDWTDGVRPTVPVEFRVSLPAARAVRVTGSGEAVIGDVTGEALRLQVSGSGDIRAGALRATSVDIEVSGSGDAQVSALRSGELRCAVNGSGNVSIAGEAEAVTVEVNGTGLYRGSALRSAVAQVAVRGSGKAFVWAEEKLAASITGNGRVTYRGAPVVQASTQGDGRVVPLTASASAPPAAEAR